MSLIGVGNFALGMLNSPLKWVWMALNIAVLFFDFTMLRWSARGLLWRKAKDQMEREGKMIEDRFFAILNEEYKRS
jgi:hypothetical protein